MAAALPRVPQAQERVPADGGRTPSLGQPGLWKWTAGASMGGADRADSRQLTSELRATLIRDLGNPVIGLGALHLEGFAGTRDGEFDGGVRAKLAIPFMRLSVGADHNFGDRQTRLLLSLVHPGRRGGLFTDGSLLRLDVAPGAERSVALGLDKPIRRRVPPGASRPRADRVRMRSAAPPAWPRPTAPGALDALAEARESARWIGEMTVPWLDHPSGNRRASEAAVLERISVMGGLLAPAPGQTRGRTLDSETRRFHDAGSRAFRAALAEAAPRADVTIADTVHAHARRVLLDEVLLPYDRLLGQYKAHDTTREFARRARAIFVRWLHVESRVPAEAVNASLSVFASLLDIVEENRASIRAQWKDPRFVWLPLQYALRPEEHDTQGELDAIVQRAAGQQFTDGNSVSYVINEQFQFQLSRTIQEAEDYHVFWVHDIRGTDGAGDPDDLSFRHVLRSYMRALTQRVKEYDRTGRLPVYMILLDEWFYDVRHGRMWMDPLEDPLRHRLRLARGFEEWEGLFAAAQDSLRAAVANSRLLQAQRTQYGDQWLHDLVKVHVNITNAAENSFASRLLVRGLPVPDNMLRDHRKLVFYDITEKDPYRGQAIYTGAGVGEHYANESWEDRALLLRGPAALQLKTAARNVLLAQGITPSQLPWHLRAQEFAADYNERVQEAAGSERRPLRALGLHNNTGYGQKDVNVGKAVLYTLMPPGSVIKIPDSLWNSAFWSSALAGCALRGGRVLVIAPSVPNAPVPAFGSMEHSYEMLWRLMNVSNRLAPQLTSSGGLLRVGVFSTELGVTDIPAKIRGVKSTFLAHAWLRELFALPDTVYRMLDDFDRFEGLAMAQPKPGFETTGFPKLHFKTNSFASREAWDLMARSEWINMTWEFVLQRIAQVQARSAFESFDEYPDALLDIGDGVVQQWFDGLSPQARERVVFYTVFGSQNQNARSMVMDGEAALVVSGWPSVIPYLDLIAIIGQTQWVEDEGHLARLLPPKGPIPTRLAHWFRLAF